MIEFSSAIKAGYFVGDDWVAWVLTDDYGYNPTATLWRKGRCNDDDFYRAQTRANCDPRTPYFQGDWEKFLATYPYAAVITQEQGERR